MRARCPIATAAPAALLALSLTGCLATPPDGPTDVGSIVAASAWQSDGPLGDGTEGVERTDAVSLADLAEVLALPDTARDDVDCAWSTSTSVDVTYDGGDTGTFMAEACGARGRDEALGRLVAEWAAAG